MNVLDEIITHSRQLTQEGQSQVLGFIRCLEHGAESRLRALGLQQPAEMEKWFAELLARHLEDQEDIRESEEAYQRYLRGEEKTISLEALEKKLGMES